MLFEAQIIRAAATDPKAFTQLYRHYLKPSYAFIAFRVNRAADAEDLTSELWMKVLDRLPTLENPKPEVFRAWLFTMARNLVIDHYRKNKTLVFIEEVELEDEATRSDFLEEENLRKLVHHLPPAQGEAVSLKYFSGLRNKEIAALLGASEKTVAANLSRALQSLKKSMSTFSQ